MYAHRCRLYFQRYIYLDDLWPWLDWLVKHLCEMGCCQAATWWLSLHHGTAHSFSLSLSCCLSPCLIAALFTLFAIELHHQKHHCLQLNGHSICAFFCLYFFMYILNECGFVWGSATALRAAFLMPSEHWKESSDLESAPRCEWVIKKYCGCILAHNEGL